MGEIMFCGNLAMEEAPWGGRFHTGKQETMGQTEYPSRKAPQWLPFTVIVDSLRLDEEKIRMHCRSAGNT